MSRLVPSIALGLVLVAAHANAQIEKGDSQISLQGSLSTEIGSTVSSTSGSLGGTYSYFITRQIALRSTAFLTASTTTVPGDIASVPSSTTEISGIYGAGIELNLTGAGQKFVPYLAFEALSSTSQQGDQSSVLLGPSVGARAFVSRSTAFDVAMRYQTTSDNTSAGTLQTTFGFSFFFGSDRRR